MSDAWGLCANCGEFLFGVDRCCMHAFQKARPLHEKPTNEDPYPPYPDTMPADMLHLAGDPGSSWVDKADENEGDEE